MQRSIMRMSKKAVSMTLILLLLFSLFAGTGITAAADSDFPTGALIIIGDKTVTKSMKADDVLALFGEPKLVTVSAFGGNAYTFYGENYSDYLYIETVEDGSIAAYGSVSDNYRTARYSYGTVDDDYVSSGTRAYKNFSDKKLYGMVGHNNSVYKCNALTYNTKVAAQSYLYGKALAKHSVEMFNAVSALYGYQSPIQYDDKTYDYIIQLVENGNTPDGYANASGLDGYNYFLGSGIYSWDSYTYINPLYFAKNASSYQIPESYPDTAFIFYSVNGNCRSYRGTVNPALFEKDIQPVPLTEEEEALYAQMQALSDSCSAHANAATDYYDEPMDISTMPIQPGKINEEVLLSAVDYLNMVRAGGGLAPVTLSETLCEGAQAKAAYTVYLSANGVSNPNPHYPPQIDGVSDEFYQLCQIGGSENLYWGNALVSILKALDDNYGDPIWCGHRYNLLDPTAYEIGIGATSSNAMSSQGAHKLNQNYYAETPEFVCWPSQGVTPMEAIYSRVFSWTARSYSGYRFNRDSEVDVTLLNNGDTWHFDNNSKYYDVSSTMVNFCDESLVPSAGHVYEVTLRGLIAPDGSTTDYTYRCAFVEMFSDEAQEAEVSLDNQQLTMKEGEEFKLNGTLSVTGSSPYIVRWSSSDESVVTVSPCGLLTAQNAGDAVITAYCGGSSVKCAVTVESAPYSLWGDVDGSGAVDIMDVSDIQRRLCGLLTYLTDEGIAAGDVDRDEELTIADATYIQRLLAGIPDSAEAGKKRTVS